jgi:hypothetical protein
MTLTLALRSSPERWNSRGLGFLVFTRTVVDVLIHGICCGARIWMFSVRWAALNHAEGVYLGRDLSLAHLGCRSLASRSDTCEFDDADRKMASNPPPIVPLSQDRSWSSIAMTDCGWSNGVYNSSIHFYGTYAFANDGDCAHITVDSARYTVISRSEMMLKPVIHSEMRPMRLYVESSSASSLDSTEL